MNEGLVLQHVNSETGEIVIIDFPDDFIPHTGMILTTKVEFFQWRIIGISLPILVEMLNGSIKSPFNSVRIWECLLRPINHEKGLSEGDLLRVI